MEFHQQLYATFNLLPFNYFCCTTVMAHSLYHCRKYQTRWLSYRSMPVPVLAATYLTRTTRLPIIRRSRSRSVRCWPLTLQRNSPTTRRMRWLC